eukprot:867935-Rhodomonas_salina.1
MQMDNAEYASMVSQENHFTVFNTVTTTTTTTMTTSCFSQAANTVAAKLSDGGGYDCAAKEITHCSIGECGVCNQVVYANEPKGLDDGGVYYHHPCWLIRFGDWSE